MCNVKVDNCISQVRYRQYCESRFSKLIGKPAIFDEENEEYALMRCREIWEHKYPSEPFGNEVDSDSENPICVTNEDILDEVKRQRFLYLKFSEPYMCELVYLIAARQRYKGFLYILQKFSDGCSLFVPASDIQLMWLTHLVGFLHHCYSLYQHASFGILFVYSIWILCLFFCDI